MTSGMSRSVPIAVDIVEMPTKRRPKPITISPDFFTTWFGMKFIITAPANTKIGAIAERRKATRSAVTVVPMFAPRMMPQALFSAMRPEFTKVTAMTVAVLEDWITAVKNSPTRRPVSRLRVKVSRMARSFAPATFSIPWLIMYIPAINRPRPPKRLTSIVSMFSPLIFVASSPQDVRLFLLYVIPGGNVFDIEFVNYLTCPIQKRTLSKAQFVSLYSMYSEEKTGILYGLYTIFTDFLRCFG